MSPREFSIACEAHRLERDDQVKRDRMLAWHIANWAGAAFAGKLPPFAEAVGLKVEGRQGPAQIRAALTMIAGHGGRVAA